MTATDLICEFSPGEGPFDTPVWVDITDRLCSAKWTVGRTSEFDQFPPGTASLVLKNDDRQLDPEYTAGTWFGLLQPRTPFRLLSISSALNLTGTSGAYASTPDHSSLDITGDIDIRADLTCTDWTALQSIVSKYNTTGNQRSYRLRVTLTGFLELVTSPDGTATVSATSNAALPVADGAPLAVRATRDVNNGAAGNTTTFYTASSMNGPWTILGTAVINASTTSIFNSTAVLEVGAVNSGTIERLTGKVRAVEVRNGIAGSVVANPEFAAQEPGTTSFVDRSGRTWTVNGTASIALDTAHRTDQYYGFVSGGFVQDYEPPEKAQCLVQLEDMLGVLQGESLPKSALEVEILADNAAAYWALDESEGTQMADSSGNGNHGSYDNGEHVDPLVFGDGRAFRTIHVADDRGIFKGETLPTAPPCTIEAWLKTAENHSFAKPIVVVQRDANLASRLELMIDGGLSYGTDTGTALVGFTNLPSDYRFHGHTIIDNDTRHHVALSIGSTTAADIKLYVDGVLQTKTVLAGTNGFNWTGHFWWTIGNYTNNGFGDFGLDGDIDEVAVFSTALSAARIQAHYEAGSSAFSDEFSGARIGRVLDIIGLPATLRDIATGDSTVGPASYEGENAGQYLAAVAESEQGYLYVNHRNGGKVTFRGRYSRLTSDRSTAVLATFTDADGTGNLHYERGGLDVDPNSAAATINIVDAEWRGGTVSVRDQTAVDQYGPQRRSIRTEAPSQSGAASAGDWIVTNYSQPQARVRGFRLAPDADKRVRPVASDLQISDRIATVRQPQFVGTATTNELYVEGYSHSFEEGVHWSTDVVTSAADLGDWWIWDVSTWNETTRWG